MAQSEYGYDINTAKPTPGGYKDVRGEVAREAMLAMAEFLRKAEEEFPGQIADPTTREGIIVRGYFLEGFYAGRGMKSPKLGFTTT